MRAEAFRRHLERGPLLLDGGLGSLLIEQGLPVGRAPEWWVLEHPDILVEVHRAYQASGSDVIHTATFGASPPKLASAGLAGRCREVNRRAVDLAREGAEGRALVAGDLGPTGLHLPPLGSADEAGLEEVFREQARELAAAGADLLSIETMYDLREAASAVRAAASTGLGVMASMTFEARRRGAFTIMGDPLAASLAALAGAGAQVAGMNCSLTPREMLPLVAQAAGAADCPLSVQPNAGQPRATSEGVVYDADPAELARDVLAMHAAGAGVLGGCCGTTPDLIRRLREALGPQALP